MKFCSSLVSDDGGDLVHPEVEAGHDDPAADDGGQGGPLAQDEVGQQHVEHRGQAPGQIRAKLGMNYFQLPTYLPM